MNETIRILTERKAELLRELHALNTAIKMIEAKGETVEPPDVPFGERIVGLMKDRGLSGRELSRMIGRSPSYMVTLTTGKTEIPNAATVQALSEALGADLFSYCVEAQADEKPADAG